MSEPTSNHPDNLPSTWRGVEKFNGLRITYATGFGVEDNPVREVTVWIDADTGKVIRECDPCRREEASP